MVKERDIVDHVPELERQPGLAQRFMESPAIAWMYERAFRPAFTRLGSSVRYADEARFLSGHVRPVDGPLLDIACGTGRYTRWLARRYEDREVVGLDLSLPMLRQALRTAGDDPRISFVRASALALPFTDRSFGGVNCFAALHLFPDPELALDEVGRVLRPGGSFTCLTACHVAGGLRERAQGAFSRLAKFRFFDLDDLRRSLEGAGMEAVELELHGAVVMFSARARSR